MPSLRHRVRTIALQILFELDATDHAPDAVVARCVAEEQLPPDGERFLRRLVFGAWEHYPYLDRIIEEAAPSWPVSQMPGVDKAILRIALYEILIDEDEKTPVKAVINEAVELAKHFGSDNSSRFINGVLGTVVTRYIERPGAVQPHTPSQAVERSNRMPSPEMEARLKKIVAEQLGVEESRIVPTARFTDDLNADSLDLVEMIMSLEEEFDIEIPDEAAEKIVTVQDAIDYIDQHKPAS